MSFFLTSCFFSGRTSFFRRCRRSHCTISLSSLTSHELLPPPLSSRLLLSSPSSQSSLRHRSCCVCSLSEFQVYQLFYYQQRRDFLSVMSATIREKLCPTRWKLGGCC